MNRLDITKVQGKKRRLSTYIDTACQDTFYAQLYLTKEQYIMLERSKELSMYPWQDYPPEGRIYISNNGAMEIKLKRWHHFFTEPIANTIASLKSL